MVCLRNICINTQHKGDNDYDDNDDDDDDNNNNNNNVLRVKYWNWLAIRCSQTLWCLPCIYFSDNSTSMAEARCLWTVPNGQRLGDPQIISRCAQIRTATSQVKQFQQRVRSLECYKSVLYKEIYSPPSNFAKHRISLEANCLVNQKCLAIYGMRRFTDVLTKARHRSPQPKTYKSSTATV